MRAHLKKRYDYVFNEEKEDVLLFLIGRCTGASCEICNDHYRREHQHSFKRNVAV